MEEEFAVKEAFTTPNKAMEFPVKHVRSLRMFLQDLLTSEVDLGVSSFGAGDARGPVVVPIGHCHNAPLWRPTEGVAQVIQRKYGRILHRAAVNEGPVRRRIHLSRRGVFQIVNE